MELELQNEPEIQEGFLEWAEETESISLESLLNHIMGTKNAHQLPGALKGGNLIASLFHAFSPRHGDEDKPYFSQHFQVVALPQTRLDRFELRPGDLLIQRMYAHPKRARMGVVKEVFGKDKVSMISDKGIEIVNIGEMGKYLNWEMMGVRKREEEMWDEGVEVAAATTEKQYAVWYAFKYLFVYGNAEEHTHLVDIEINRSKITHTFVPYKIGQQTFEKETISEVIMRDVYTISYKSKREKIHKGDNTLGWQMAVTHMVKQSYQINDGKGVLLYKKDYSPEDIENSDLNRKDDLLNLGYRYLLLWQDANRDLETPLQGGNEPELAKNISVVEVGKAASSFTYLGDISDALQLIISIKDFAEEHWFNKPTVKDFNLKSKYFNPAVIVETIYPKWLGQEKMFGLLSPSGYYGGDIRVTGSWNVFKDIKNYHTMVVKSVNQWTRLTKGQLEMKYQTK